LDAVVARLTQELDAKDQALRDAQQREETARELEQSLRAELKEAVSAIPKQTEIPNAEARIQEALEQAAKGNTVLAEAIFSEVEVRKAAEGKLANKEAAEAARHRGALAFLHNTDKALAAYRKATELDPENAGAWNGLGLLLVRTGALDEAAEAYRTVVSLGKATSDRELLAVAYDGLGTVSRIRGDPEQAESMCRQALDLFQSGQRLG